MDARRGPIIEDAYRSVGLPSRVVLPQKARPAAKREVAALPAEPPDDPSRPPPDLVDGLRVPRGDEEVAVVILRDRVDVKEVVRNGSLSRPLCIRLGERDVPDAVPVQENAPRAQVELLEAAVGDRAAPDGDGTD